MKRLFARGFWISCLLIFAIGCARSTDFLYKMPNPAAPAKGKPAGPGALGGTVTDTSGHALAQVQVHLAGVGTVSTDSAGHYSFNNVPAHNYKVDFSLLAYSPATGVAVAVVGGRSSILNIMLTQHPGSLEGYVSDAATNLPLTGVTVQLHVNGETTPIRSTIQTDSSGHYSFANLPAGTYALDFSLAGYVSLQGATTNVFDGQDTRFDVTLSSVNGQLIGSVMDANYGSYLPGVQIVVHAGAPNGTVVAQTQTNANGGYSVPNLAAGIYYVDFSDAGYSPVMGAMAQIFTGQTTTLNMQLGSVNGGLQGHVTNAMNGLPLAGVSVVLHTSSGAPMSTTTDFSGYYKFGGVAAGQVTVDFSLSGFVPVMGAPATLLSGQTATLNESLTPVVQPGAFRIVLSWKDGNDNVGVADVNSYLQVPGDSRPVNFKTMGGTGANLDFDTTTWRGPETVTITSMQQGTYDYYVNNYNDRCDKAALGNSQVVVHVYDSTGLIKTYNVPPGTGITYDVFHMQNGQVQDVLQYNDNLFIEDANLGGNCSPFPFP